MTTVLQSAAGAGEQEARGPGASAVRRVALVGAGYIADWHAKCLRSVAGVELAAVCDVARSRAQALAGAYGIPRVYGALDEMLVAERLDAVHILLPPDRHFEAARAAIEAGVHVLLEKPMCDNAADCERLVRLAEERGVRVGVGHNFLFAEPYERLRRDVGAGVLGKIDSVAMTWNRDLPQARLGPFDAWMLREPRNMMLETGSHLAAFALDLLGEPEQLQVRADNAVELPTGKSFYRRWQVSGRRDGAAIEMRFSFVPGFAEFNVHVRGSLAAATADLEHNTYVLDHYRAADPDLENYELLAARAKALKQQGRQTLKKYILSKLGREKRGTPYAESIARAMDAFYGNAAAGNASSTDARIDRRIDPRRAARVIAVCEEMGALAGREPERHPMRIYSAAAEAAAHPRILVLGATGFIGRELVRQLIDDGRGVRMLVRSAASVPEEIRSQVDCRRGDAMQRESLIEAMQGIDCVVHLARSNVKTWADYLKYEIDVTRQIAECALEAGVKRFVYTGTIDSYYGGLFAGRITEKTPLDRKIERRNLYARAKAASEEALLGMHRDRGLPLVIVRPGVVIGRGGSPFHWGVGMWWHDAICQTWGSGKNKLPLVLVEDVARGIVAAMQTPGIEGQAFNLVADPCLTAREYLDALDRAAGIRIERQITPIWKFYMRDMFKWMVKVAVRHPERRRPSYRDWASRSGRGRFDCTAAKTVLGWEPVSDREEMLRRGIEEPVREWMA